ncbi:hypothetical protein BJ982_005182 [Sphaerisporangium siamense]|uniref:Uncharacterized protein n=1 Tax=Sphaerisporangium siamense TaxID=795645 RepID=A0A7W7DDZ4_9ACTN|nr:hypothetical protein [Sphaerisporangium siamense]
MIANGIVLTGVDARQAEHLLGLVRYGATRP